ncbi:MAG TPA: (2Fe-2S)-binding protein [Nitrospirota bacterium]|nr:(2Fe-2S)-binding protein [Nitrospirota bacterium]
MKNEEHDKVKKEGTENNEHSQGLTRRSFLTTIGAGAVTLAVSDKIHATPAADAEMIERGEMTKVVLHINGRKYRLLVEPRWSLLYVLREQLGLTGTKVGCERGECGSCTVLIDDVPRYACITLAVEAERAKITTLEGLMKGEELGPVQQAFVEQDAMQCGYCTPGQIMAVEGLLRKNPHPSTEEIRNGMSGNLCRCGAYKHIINAAKRAAELKRP